MANYSDLIARIQSDIYENTQNEITGAALQGVLLEMVDELGRAGALFGGVVGRSFAPQPTDSDIYYIAGEPGTYTNLGLSVGVGELAILWTDGVDWHKEGVGTISVQVAPEANTGVLLATLVIGGQSYQIKAEAKDSTPTADSTKPVTSGGVWTAVNTLAQSTAQALALKADKTYVDAQDATKADTTYVDAQLATKADATATANALATKADKTYVDTQLATKADASSTTAALNTKANKDTTISAGTGLTGGGSLASNRTIALDSSSQTALGKANTALQPTDVVDNVTSSATNKPLSANQGKVLKSLVDSKADASATTTALAGKADKVSGATAGDVAALDASGNLVDGGVPADNIAQQDGYYQSLTAGTAEDLVGRGSVSAEFTRRTSGGTADIGTGAAAIKKIKGNTIVWNQLVDSGTTSVTIPSGHKYYAIINGTRTYGTSDGTAINVAGGTDTIHDLTQMFVSGNEPTASEFEALFPLDYYAYNAGSLLNLTATGLVTTGFNQWDEEWELGQYSNSTGGPAVSNTNIRSKNYIPVIGGQTYYGRVPSTAYQLRCCTYDANKTFLKSIPGGFNNSTITFDSNVAYIKICTVSGLATTYNNDICINLSWSGVRNGEYKPYEVHTLALPITTMTSSESAVFPDGMKSAGAAYDETDGVKAVKRIEKVDLGSLSWSVNAAGTANERAYTSGLSSVIKAPGANTDVANITCSKYIADTASSTYLHLQNNSMGVNTAGNFYIYSTDLIGLSGDQIRSALSGVYLYYELATPVEYTLDTPLNLNYYVNDFGTEEITPANGSTPTTSPIIYDVQYAMNAVDTLRNLPKNYISKASMEAILTAFQTAGVITSYTLTWDSTNEKYNCSITV